MSLCRSCDAPIRWATTLAGKAMPLDAAPVDNGNVQLMPAPGGFRAVVLAGGDLERAREAGVRLYYPHHASCEHGKQWKR